MRREGLDLLLQNIADVDDRRSRRERNRLAVRQREIGRGIVKFLYAMRLQPGFELFDIPVAASGPMKRHGGKNGRHGVIRMRCDRAFRAQCDHHLRTYLANTLCQHAHDLEEIRLIEPGIGITENFRLRDFEQFAGIGKLLTTQFAQIFSRLCPAAMSCRLAVCQADHVRLDAALGAMQECAGKTADFVIRMRRNAQQFEQPSPRGRCHGPCSIVTTRIDQLITNYRISFDVGPGILHYSLPTVMGKLNVHGLAIGLVLMAALASSAQMLRIPISINNRIPLGIESFRLQPGNQSFYLLASAEDPTFIGLRRVTVGNHDNLVANDGKVVHFYPKRVQFRLTASARDKIFDDPPFDTDLKLPLDQLLIKLRFRMKIFHGLAYRYVQPSYVENIGMPSDIPYNERIYRIGFVVGQVPIEDRIVMEVLAPSGERLCKFHLDLL
jgi:hypothetical protein